MCYFLMNFEDQITKLHTLNIILAQVALQVKAFISLFLAVFRDASLTLCECPYEVSS